MRLLQQPESRLRFLLGMRYNEIMLIGCNTFKENSMRELSQELELVMVRTIENMKVKLWLKG